MKLGYKGMIIDCSDHSLGTFGSEKNHDINIGMVSDYIQIYRNRTTQFIKDDFDNYIDQLNWEYRVEN